MKIQKFNESNQNWDINKINDIKKDLYFIKNALWEYLKDIKYIDSYYVDDFYLSPSGIFKIDYRNKQHEQGISIIENKDIPDMIQFINDLEMKQDAKNFNL